MALTKAHNRMIEGSYLNVKDFGATGDGTTDDTAAIQATINYASNNNIATVFFPDGHYIYSVLYLYYDATDNPGFQQTPLRHARIRFLGCGKLAIANLKSYGNPDALYGTVLESSAGGAGLIVSSDAEGHDGGTYPARKFEAEQMTFVGNNTTQIIEAASCPFMSFSNCSFLQRNTAGDGIVAQSSWMFSMDNCIVVGPSSSTGRGIVAGTSIFAGVWTVEQTVVDRWQDGISWTEGEFVNIAVRDSAIQNNSRYAIHGDGGIARQLILDNVYFEALDGGVSFIKGDSNVIRNLVIDGGYMLCGTGLGVSNLSAEAIDLDTVDFLEMSGCYVFRMAGTVVNVTAVASSQRICGTVRNSSFITDATPASTPVYLFTGVLPNFENNTWTNSTDGLYDATSDVKLFDDTTAVIRDYVDGRTAVSTFSSLGLGDISVQTGVSGTVTIPAVGSRTVYDITHTVGAGISLTLPDVDYMPVGRLFIIKNNSASSGAIAVRNASDASAVKTIAAGSAGMFVFDAKNSGKYIDTTL